MLRDHWRCLRTSACGTCKPCPKCVLERCVATKRALDPDIGCVLAHSCISHSTVLPLHAVLQYGPNAYSLANQGNASLLTRVVGEAMERLGLFFYGYVQVSVYYS